MANFATNTKRFLCIILSALLTVSAVSCANSSTPEETTQQNTANPTADVTAPEEEETEKLYLDNLPETMDYGGEEICIVAAYEDKSITLGEDDDVGDVVNDAYWKRNTGLETRMNVKIELAGGASTGYGEFNGTVNRAIQAGSTEYDLLCGHTRFNVSCAANGYLLDMNDGIFTDIIDLSQPYWSTFYIENLTYKNLLYWITGDVSHNFVGYIYGMFVNGTVWENLYPGQNVYDYVFEGTWTLDKLNQLCDGSYQDLNANGLIDNSDVLGVIMQKGHTLNGMFAACDTEYTNWDPNGDLVITLASEHTVDTFNKLHNLFYNTTYGLMLSNDEFGDVSKAMFSEDRVLFCPQEISFASDDKIRDMQSDFSIIPLPKFDEQQERYCVNQYDGIPIYGFPTTVVPEQYEMLANFLEAFCSMTSQYVIPAYYDLALKNKYSRDQTTAQMIDLIHENITGDFGFYWGDSLGGLMNIFYDNIDKDEIASTMASKQKTWDKALNRLIGKLEK